MNQLPKTLTSVEIAEMVGRDHNNVMKDIRRIIDQLGEVTSYQSYFIESSYVNSQNKELPNFLLTKKGCELFATRMNGEKGTQFAIRYIERFNEMEQQIRELPQMSNAQLLAAIAQTNVEQEQRIMQLEQKQQHLEQTQSNIQEIITLTPMRWRDKANAILSRIAIKRGGGGEQYQAVRNESYDILEERARCNLNIRLENRKKNALVIGIKTRSQIDKMTKMDIIAEDARLTEIYIAIVKEMAIKYQVNVEGLGA